MLLNAYNNATINSQIERLLGIIDPFNNKHITYSECVDLFSEEIVDTVQDEVTVLGLVSMNNNL